MLTVRRFRVARPLQIHGRLAATGEIVHLPTHSAQEWVESGHLVALEVEVAGETSRRWIEPLTR